MTKAMRTRRFALGALASATGLALFAGASLYAGPGDAAPTFDRTAVRHGVARAGEVTVAIAPALEVDVSGDKASGRPIVVIDPGHGGHDPGASGVSGRTNEKGLALLLATDLRDRLVERGRVRVALTRTDDRYLSLEDRAEVARRLDAAAYLSLHLDSAANPDARGLSVYSLSDVASDEAAARLAASENGGETIAASGSGVAALLDDLALRDRMMSSAALAERLIRKSQGRVALRPEPHRFAAFHVLRRAEVPAILVEAGYVSNAKDEAQILNPAHRRRLVEAIADAVEADVASRTVR